MGSAPVRRTGPGGGKTVSPPDRPRPPDKPVAPHIAGMGRGNAPAPALAPARPPQPAERPAEQPAEDEYPFATPGRQPAEQPAGHGFHLPDLVSDIGGHVKPMILTQSLRWHAQGVARLLGLSDADVRDCLLTVLDDYPGEEAGE